MRTYHTIHNAVPGIRLPLSFSKFDFNIKDPKGTVKISMTPMFEIIGQEKIQNGMQFDTDISAKNLDAAIERSNGYVNLLVNIFSFVSRYGIEAKLWIIFETTEKEEEKQFVQYIKEEEISKYYSTISRGDLDLDFVRSIITQMERIGKDKDAQRILRTIRWYRQGISEDDAIDRFICYWTGLENLEELLKKHYHSTFKKSCPNCGSIEGLVCIHCGNKVENIAQTNAIKQLFEEMYPDSNYFKIVNRLRNDILHGNRNLDDLIIEVRQYLKIMNIVISKAILLALGIDGTIDEKKVQEIQKVPLLLRLETTLSNFDPSDYEKMGYPPQFFITFDSESGGRTEKKVSINSRFRFDPQVYPGTRVGKLTLNGQLLSSDVKMELNFEN